MKMEMVVVEMMMKMRTIEKKYDKIAKKKLRFQWLWLRRAPLWQELRLRPPMNIWTKTKGQRWKLFR